MCEMLANKYLVDGQIEKAIDVFEKMLSENPGAKTLLYSLFISYALSGRCSDVLRTAHQITGYFNSIEKKIIRLYQNRLPDDALRKIRTSLESLCTEEKSQAIILNRLVLAELTGDDNEVTVCLKTMEQLNPAISIT